MVDADALEKILLSEYPLIDWDDVLRDVPQTATSGGGESCESCAFFNAGFHDCENEDGLWRGVYPDEFCSKWRKR